MLYETIPECCSLIRSIGLTIGGVFEATEGFLFCFVVDALIAAMCKGYGITKIATFDKDFCKSGLSGNYQPLNDLLL